MLSQRAHAVKGSFVSIGNRATKAKEAVKGRWEDFWEAIAEYMVNWGYFWSPIRLAIVYEIASRECNFSAFQSIFLAVFWAFGFEARKLRRVAAKQFVPFSFSISPNYRTALTDAGLLANDPEGNERDFATLIKSQPEGKIPWSGTECRVIGYDSDSDRHVIAYEQCFASFENPHPREPRRQHYSSRLQFGFGRFDLESLPLSSAFPAGCHAGGSRMQADFWAEPRRGGIGVFMAVDRQWYAARWGSAAPERPKFLDEYGPDRTELTLAVIPYTELQCFYRWIPRRGIVSLRQRKRAMEALGWTGQENVYGVVEHYSHKYLDFYHSPLNG